LFNRREEAMSDQYQEAEQEAAARREALLIARLVLWGWQEDLLRASAQEAYRAVAWYVERVGWPGSSVAWWYAVAAQAPIEQQAFLHQWDAWQQAQRERLGMAEQAAYASAPISRPHERAAEHPRRSEARPPTARPVPLPWFSAGETS
jgi:hypothetical protein